ncbi:MAG TPA: hypothetical protein VFR76_15450 [Verrucomicrobiae bacterium]|nr:hypothetical protein [Verrucomicrobiae bacterium]
MILCWLGVLVLAHSATAETAETRELRKPPATPSASARTAVTNNPWGRIVMVGASVSAGFVASEPLGGPTTSQHRLSRYVDAALLVPHEPVQNLASSLFFVQPEAVGAQQIEAGVKAQPSLVLGIDFLFWFCYGEGSTDAERLQRFEKGLKMLEAFKCPLVLGDIPDASAAVNGMLRPDQIPSGKAMAAANQRLKEWAATRPQTGVLPLSAFMRTVVANQSLTVHGYNLPEGKTRLLLQEDQLHPSPPGCAVIALAALDAFQATRPAGPDAAEIRWDPREIFRQVATPPPGPATKPSKPAVPTAPVPK